MDETYTLITGASSGFGRSIALRLARSRRLVLTGRNVGKLDEVRRKCETPERHLVWVEDLNRVGAIREELASFLASRNIRIDHFIHSAGVTGIQLARAVEPEFVNRVFNVNVFAAMEIIGALVQRRVNRGALRSITLISSIASELGAKGYSVYAASKGAVNALTRSLAVELAPAVRANAVLPGIIETEMTREYFVNSDFVALYPLGAGRPADVADAVEFLSSDRARWITGQEMVVDGGRSIFSPTPQ
ncbi:MAG: SDR family NAD(P)-dependent oxidoreductase [Bryobacteraceae bacterium]